jgi:SAM-dependent methyltransferase
MIDRKRQIEQYELLRQEFLRAKAYAGEYVGKTPQSYFFNTRIRRVSELLSGFHQGKVLDVGCGPAIIANIFRGRPIEYHGIDLSEAMIDYCRNSFSKDPQFTFSIQNIENLEFDNDCFDVVLCLGVLEYVLDKPSAVREAVRVLRPGGILIATMLNKASPFELYSHYVQGRFLAAMRGLVRYLGLQRSEPNEMIERPRKPSTLILGEKAFRILLTSEGLNVEDILYYDFHLVPPPWDSRLSGFSLSISRRLEFLARSILRFLGRGYMMKGRKLSPGVREGLRGLE